MYRTFRPALLIILLCTAFFAVQGQSWTWVKPVTGAGNQNGRCIAVDPVSGAIYVAGTFENSLPAFGLTSGGLQDIFLARYYPNGDLDWAVGMGGLAVDEPFGLAADGSGAVYMTGVYRQAVDFGGNGASVPLTSVGNEDIFLAKYDSLGRAIWVRSAGGTSPDRGNDIALVDDQVYICGAFTGTLSLNGGLVTLPALGNYDAFLARYDTSGTFQWANSWGGLGSDEALSVAADAGGVYVSGVFNGATISIPSTSLPILLGNSQLGFYDLFLARFRPSDGLATWANKSGGSGNERGNGVAVDANRVYLGGEFAGTAAFGSLGNLTSAGGQDLFLAAYDKGSGTGIWLSGQGSTGEDRVLGVDVNPNGVWITGGYTDAMVWGGDNLPKMGNRSVFVGKYSHTGTYLWSGFAGSAGADRGTAISLDSGAAYLCGEYGSPNCAFTPSPGLSLAGVNLQDMFLGRIRFVDPPPVAVNDTLSIFRDSSIVIAVLANDSNPGFFPPLVSVVCPAQNGTATVTNDSIHYQPNPAFVGQDSFCYSICIYGPLCDTAWVYINVIDPLHDPNPGPGLQSLRMGSLVIPMDSALQMDVGNRFNLYAYGLANALLQANIPLKWCIRTGKTRDGVDFSALTDRIYPSSLPAAMHDFIGGPLVIDSIYADSALVVIADYVANVSPVSVFRLQQNVGAEVRFFLTHKPRIAIFNNGGNQAVHQLYLDEAGFDATHYTVLQPSATSFDSLACYTFASEPDWAGATLTDTLESRLVRQFLEYGGNFLAQNTAIVTYEWLEGFQTIGGLRPLPFFTGRFDNPDMPFAQVHGDLLHGNGPAAGFELMPEAVFLPTTYALVRQNIRARFKATANKVGNASAGGMCYYLGGNNYHLGSNPARNGRRMYLDAILVPPLRPPLCNLDFSCDVAVEKAVLPGDYCMGDTVEFVIVVRNLGPGEAMEVVVRDTLDAALSFVSASATQGNYNPATHLWELGPLPYEQTDTLRVRALVSAAGPVRNHAWVSTSIHSPDLNAANDSSGVGFNALFTPDPTIAPLTPLCDNGLPVVLNAAASGGTWSGPGVSGNSFDPVVAGVGTVTIQYTVSASNCTDTDTALVTVNPSPVFSLGPDSTLCQNDSLSLDPGLAASSYAWSNSAATPTITVFNSGTYSVTVTDANNCSASDTAVATFLPLPSPNLGGTQSICTGDSLILDPGVIASAYNWSNSATTSSITVSAGGTYSVTVTDGNNCSAADTAILNLLALPVFTLGPDSSACEGDPITLSSPLSVPTYAWSTLAGTPSITVSTPGSYALTLTDANNCSFADTIGLLFHALPSPDLGPDSTLCQNDSLSLDPGLAASSYAWSNSSTSPTITVFNSGTYAVTVTDGNNCSASDTAVVTFLPLPSPNLGGNQSICTGDSLILDPGVIASTYHWSNSATTSSITVSAGGTYSVTVTDGNNCSAADTATLSLLALPMVDLGADTSACQGDTLSLTSTFPAHSYLWSNSDTNASISVTQAGSYILQVTDSNDCSASDTISIGLLALPVFSLGPDTTLCQGDSLELDPGITGAAFAWNNLQTTPTITVFGSGLYALLLTDSNGCSASDSMTAVFEAAPTPNLGGPHSVCEGDSVSLNAGSGAAGYLWSTAATSSGITVAAAGSYAVTVTSAGGCTGADTTEVIVLALPLVDASGNATALCAGSDPVLLSGVPAGGTFSGNGVTGDSLYPDLAGTGVAVLSYTFSDSNGCSDSDSFLVTVHALPQVQLSGLSSEYCESDPPDNLLLAPPGGNLSGPGSAGSSFLPQLAGTGGPFQLSYHYTDSNGCSATDSATTTVLSLPTPADAGPDQVLYSENNAVMAANHPLSGTGTWSLVAGSAEPEAPSSPITVVQGLAPGENVLVWTISAGICGSSSDTVVILRNELVIPTGFSPNGDQVNDLYVVRGIERFAVRSLKVFNRWGNLVFTSDQYTNDWSGQDLEGRPLSDDTYFMVLDLGTSGTYSQSVTIKR